MTEFKQVLQPGDTLFVSVPPVGAPPSPPAPPVGGPGPLPVGVHLTLLDQSRLVPSAVLAAYLTAQQAQLDEDFSPAWGGSAHIDHVAGGWPVSLLLHSDVPGALGYHDVDLRGRPFARVFLRDSIAAGVPWQSVASHEVLELLADADANTTDLGPDGCLWYREVGDPVEDRSYTKHGVALSDFVLPAWCTVGAQRPFDFLDLLTAPFTITPGGYAVKLCSGKVVQVGAERASRSVDRAYS